ncbi:DUF3102 domain-containing protein [Termitidicoccus mucosus]|uniref:DUF222 domain-containing protein n=1 Tax=Termitidicoccus mucosus TaxID=1184151 RepID=A0A178ILG3_9BACT|nr:hypothetical protein AW736_11720 [Opitutaceae bacterium TSB47]
MRADVITSPDSPASPEACPYPASRSRESSAIVEINRLHAEARRLEYDSRRALDSALMAAWRAGKLLIAEKARIRRHAGRGAWLPWLETCFHGGVRTAQRYMQLARRIGDSASLHGLSLRQACLRLGIAISPKSSRTGPQVLKLPAHITLAARLTRCLRARAHTLQGKPQTSPPELIALYAQLRTWCEPAP